MESWNSHKLFLKAKMFSDRANENDQGAPEFAYWCALSLECLARSALTKVHPALNADPRDDLNLLYGFGIDLTAKARSLPAHSVYLRLEKIIPDFGKAHRELCDFVALQRNSYLHTADLPYENLKPTKWLPRYYDTVRILLEFLGCNMPGFLGDEIATSADKLVKTLNENLIGAVKKKIANHKSVFEEKSDEEKTTLVQAAVIATLALGWGEISKPCPACGTDGVLSGAEVKQFPEKYENEELTTDVQFLAVGFRCAACGLVLKGLEEVTHADLDVHFIETMSTSLHDLYEPEFDQEYDNM